MWAATPVGSKLVLHPRCGGVMHRVGHHWLAVITAATSRVMLSPQQHRVESAVVHALSLDLLVAHTAVALVSVILGHVLPALSRCLELVHAAARL